MFDVSRDEITEGSLTRALLLLAAPLLVQNLVQVAQQVVDTFWVGRLGESAVAAVGLNFPVLAVLFAFTAAPFVGTQVLVSQRVGTDEPGAARRATFNGLLLALLIGVTLTAVVYVGADAVVSLLVSDPTVAPLAGTYLATVVFGLPFASMSDTLEGGFVGWGDSRAALYVNATAVVVNIGLDPFLIFGWGPFRPMGIQGAALATAIGFAAGFALAFALAVGTRESLTLGRDDVAVDVDEIRELLDVGAPTTGQGLASQSVRLVIVAVVSAVGGAAGLAAYTVGARVAAVAFIPAQGLQQAAQSVIGQNIGAERPDRAHRGTWTAVAVAVGALTVLGAVQWAAPAAIAQVFVPDLSPDGLRLTVDYLQILAYGYPAIGAMYLLLAGFNAARKTRVSMVATLVQYWGVRLPIAAVGAFVLAMGVHAVFWAVTLSNVAAAVGTGAYYRYTIGQGMLDRAVEVAAAD